MLKMEDSFNQDNTSDTGDVVGTNTSGSVGIGDKERSNSPLGEEIHCIVVQPPVTPPPDRCGRITNQLQYMAKKVFTSLWKHPDSLPFREPVVANSDYYMVVKFPMDLTTIKKRLKNNYYWSATECIHDFYAIFLNCYMFNNSGDNIRAKAATLEKLFERKLVYLPKNEIEIKVSPAKGSKKTRAKNKISVAGETTNTSRTETVASSMAEIPVLSSTMSTAVPESTTATNTPLPAIQDNSLPHQVNIKNTGLIDYDMAYKVQANDIQRSDAVPSMPTTSSSVTTTPSIPVFPISMRASSKSSSKSLEKRKISETEAQPPEVAKKIAHLEEEVTKTDSNNAFGKYVASELKRLSSLEQTHLKNDISKLITQYMLKKFTVET